MKEQSIEALASRYGLDADFVKELHEKVTDKENFARAVKMFADGTLLYDIATGKDPINIAEIRHTLAQRLWNNRKARLEKVKEMVERQKRIYEYYSGCNAVKLHPKGKHSPSDVVFIKDGLIVAFAHYEPKQGGIYMANNDVMPDFRWNPHQALAMLRKKNRAFYKQVKKAAFNSPREWFNFNETTICKK